MPVDSQSFRRLCLVALLTLGVTLSGCRKFPVESETTSEPNPDDLRVAVNTRFQLDHGEVVRLGDTGMDVRFENVLEESRCPTDAICGEIGRAGIRLVVTEDGSRDAEIVMYIPGEVEIPFEDNGAVFYKGRYFRLLGLDPYPFPGVDIPESSYRALLRIEQPK